MELCYAMISLDRLRQTILQNATDLHVAARVVIFVFFCSKLMMICAKFLAFLNWKAISHLIIIPLTFLLKNPEKLRIIAAVTEFSGVPRNRSSGILDA